MATINSHEASPSTTSRRSDGAYLSYSWGVETRKKFTDHLYRALMREGLPTFRDDDELARGEDIMPKLQKAIEGSRVCIIVLSKNYASSWRCPEKLVMILKCRSSGHLILPAFFDVNPSEVRMQTDSLKEAFMGHENRIEMGMSEQKEYLKGKVQEWRMALKEVADLAGFQFSPNIFMGCLISCLRNRLQEVKVWCNGCLDSCQRAVGFWCLSPWSFLELFSMATINSHEASPSTSRRRYEAYLSFNGVDTRKSFTDHLYHALLRKGLRTFRDEDELERGQNIMLELQKAIEGSRVCIIVLSNNYASSRWCLDELVMILKRRSSGYLVLPVFYDVDPSEVRRQTGSFKEAFMRHERRIEMEMGEQKEYLKGKVQEWRMALKEVASLSGFVYIPNIYEA